MSKTPSLGDISPEEFVYKAIERLRVPPYRGIHAVYSGFNGAFREYFPLLDPVDFVNQLVREGKITVRPVRGGVILYKTEDLPQGVSTTETIKRITANDKQDPYPPT